MVADNRPCAGKRGCSTSSSDLTDRFARRIIGAAAPRGLADRRVARPETPSGYPGTCDPTCRDQHAGDVSASPEPEVRSLRASAVRIRTGASRAGSGSFPSGGLFSRARTARRAAGEQAVQASPATFIRKRSDVSWHRVGDAECDRKGWMEQRKNGAARAAAVRRVTHIMLNDFRFMSVVPLPFLFLDRSAAEA